MIDVNLKGVLYGIAAALPVFRTQGFGHFVNIASTAASLVLPTMSVYAGTKIAVRAISEGLRQEAGDTLRVTIISPGFVRTNFAEGVTNPEVKAGRVEDSELDKERDMEGNRAADHGRRTFLQLAGCGLGAAALAAWPTRISAQTTTASPLKIG